MNITQRFFATALPELIQTKPALFSSLHRTIQFSIEGDGGGDWALALEAAQNSPNVISGRAPQSECEVRCAASTFSALVERRLTIRQAFDSALLTIQGDVGVALKLNVLFVSADRLVHS